MAMLGWGGNNRGLLIRELRAAVVGSVELHTVDSFPGEVAVMRSGDSIWRTLGPILATIFAGWAIWANTARVLALEVTGLPAAMDASAEWPEPTNVSQPWTRWWWLGSAVDDANLTRLLETYHAAGLGGVEITSIYGVQGADDRELPFLSDQWLAALRHAVREAKRLGMGVDLPTGSGWRTGGPSVSDEDGNREVVIQRESVSADELERHTLVSKDVQAVVAYGADGQMLDLSAGVKRRSRPDADETLAEPIEIYTVTERWSHDNVKRPAPGGEGRNINPLSRRSLENFLAYFAEKLGDVPAEGIRAQFHDSYEYEGNWTIDFLAEFEKRRGYKLQHHLPALNGEGDDNEVARVKHDYRETVSDLVLENMIEPWTAWSHEHGMLSRNQSHGSPANWLDLYAACDIPEIESFGRLVGGDTNRLVFKFAPSAAHVEGKPLISAETATWIDEHFTESLGQVKEIADRLFLTGVNHIVYHGTAYSPADAAWPGWLFYASTQLNPQNPIWRDFPALNEYVTRVQSVLQSTKPDNDILLYWPIHDFWQHPRGLRQNIQVHNSRDWLDRTEFGRTAKWLDEHGYSFDYISDRQLAKCSVEDGRIRTPGGGYAVLVIPGAKFLPINTGRKIVELAEAGATVISVGDNPQGTPGQKYRQEQTEFDALAGKFMGYMREADGYSSAPLGKGRIVLAEDFGRTLAACDVRRESWSGSDGLHFHRRTWDGGSVYFVKNESEVPFDGEIELQTDFAAAVLMDPMTGQLGLAEGDTAKRTVRLQLEPGTTTFIKTYREPPHVAAWSYRALAGEPTPIEGLWSVEFVAGGPELPPRFNTHRLATWTELAGPQAENFAGTTRYTIRFTPDVVTQRYFLDLGQVADSARVELNGKLVATLIAPPYRVEIGPLLAENNVLTIDVTNVAANRIRDLDRREVKWRIFKDINLVNIKYKPFDASDWPVRPAGLLGPVTITPLED
jgi:hypothetical protein